MTICFRATIAAGFVRIFGKPHGKVDLPAAAECRRSLFSHSGNSGNRSEHVRRVRDQRSVKVQKAPALHHCPGVGASDLTALRKNCRGQRGALDESGDEFAIRPKAYDGSPGRHGIPEVAAGI
jgi:hypothetical protein